MENPNKHIKKNMDDMFRFDKKCTMNCDKETNTWEINWEFGISSFVSLFEIHTSML